MQKMGLMRNRGFLALFRPILGLLSFTFMVVNVLFWAGLLHILAPLKWLPGRSVDAWVERQFVTFFEGWCYCNQWWLKTILGVEWHLDEQVPRKQQHWHLVICNHQSWVDVFVVLAQMQGRMPLPRVFMKQALFWIPLVGTSTWIMGFPFMKRYSKATLAKYPHLRGKDLQTTRRSCRRFIKYPNTVLSFVEGTRNTPEKHHQQQSPYQCLLPAKAGGIAFVLQAMPGKFTEIVDISIFYPQPQYSFWDMLCGRVRHVTVQVRKVPLAERMLSPEYAPAGQDKADFFAWFNAYWAQKDRRMAQQRQALTASATLDSDTHYERQK